MYQNKSFFLTKKIKNAKEYFQNYFSMYFIRKNELQKAITALQESEIKYRLHAENSSDVIWVINFDGQFLYVSPSFKELTGWSPDEVMDIHFEKYVTPESAAIAIEILSEQLKKPPDKRGSSGKLEIQQYSKDSSIIDVEVAYSWIIDKEGKPFGIQGRTTNITERKKAEEELGKYRDHLEDIVKERTDELTVINKKLQQEVKKHKETENILRNSEGELREKNELINKDLESARLAQQDLLPQEIPSSKLVNVAYKYKPAAQVGGDYFSFTSFFEEEALGIFIGDISGHGVSAALFTSSIRAITDRICREHGFSPEHYLERLNLELFKGMKKYYLTGIYGLYHQGDKGNDVRFTFSRGGHPHPILYQASNNNVEYINTKGVALGWFDSSNYEQKTIDLKKGDRIFLYTDGIPETTNKKNEMLQFDGFFEIIRKVNNNRNSIKDILDIIMDELDLFRDGVPFEDDIVIIGMEVK